MQVQKKGKRMTNSHAISIILYCSECWAIPSQVMKSFEAKVMWFLQETVDSYVGEVLEQQGSFEENWNRKDICIKNQKEIVQIAGINNEAI